MDFPDGSLLAAILADGRFWLALGVVILAGVVRGFSGFGSALIYIPLASAIYEPRIAAATFLLIDFSCTAPFAVQLYRLSNRREVWPLTLATALTIPLGTMILYYVDPIPLRWYIAGAIFALLGVLISGWRYKAEPSLPLTAGVGLLSGISGGATQLTGPFAIVYWLGSASGAPVVRANLMVFFALTGGLICIAYFLQGLFPVDVVTMALLFAGPYILSLAAGAYLFRGASELIYRRIAYLIVAVAALVSLPIFDGILR